MKRTFTMPDGEVITKDWPDFKTPNNHDTDFEARRTALFCLDESKTKQEFVEDADINVIIARVMQGAETPVVLPEHFLDVSKQPTFLEMHERIAETNEYFYDLPARIRSQHLNDPARWADAVHQAAAIADEQKLKELGVELQKPQEGDQGTPPSTATPAPAASQAPPAAPPSGAPTAGDKSPANVTAQK